jgi:hypothetical protein
MPPEKAEVLLDIIGFSRLPPYYTAKHRTRNGPCATLLFVT